WFGLLANLIAVPVTALWIMPLALVTLLLMPLGLEGPVVFLMGLGISLLLWVAETVAGWPGAISLLPSITPLGLGLLVMGGLWLIIWRRRWRWLGLPFVLAGWSTVALHSPPHILVSQEARLIALLGPDGDYYFNRLRGGRFVRESWLEDQGEDKTIAANRGFDAAVGDWLNCDALGCRALLAGRSVALVREPLAFQEDCRRNDIVVSFSPAPQACATARSPPALVIDGSRLAQDKALAIWLDEEEVKLNSVAAVSGQRPWAWWSRADLGARQ
ncbi:MAG: ComEC/Rec2 family competence protein, partial [Firmicutes bacterium]|nr:ComEC/Rec2 family competence protein [Bacillota bacterium]